MKNAAQHAFTIAIVTIVAIASTTAIVGCAAARDLETRIWGTPESPVEDPAGSPPPILELVAAALASLGYGGMAGWIHRNKKLATNCQAADKAELQRQLAQVTDGLQTEIGTLAADVKATVDKLDGFTKAALHN